jgi:competence protein ComEA
MSMLAALTSVAFVTLILVAPVAVAAERADTPAVRSSLPTHVDAPRGASAKEAPARVREPQRDARAPVNINTADVSALMTLSGVTRKVAERIVAYRATHGRFIKAAEIRKVEGFGDAVWERNRARIVVK